MGRTQRYPYYRCRFVERKSVNVREERREEEFVALISGMAPQRGVMSVFAEERGFTRAAVRLGTSPSALRYSMTKSKRAWE